MHFAAHTLKNGQILTIVQPGPELAGEIVAYVNHVGGESDNLTLGENEFGMSVADEAAFLKKTQESESSLLIAGVLDGKIVSIANLSRSPRPRIKHVATFGITVLKKHYLRKFWIQA